MTEDEIRKFLSEGEEFIQSDSGSLVGEVSLGGKLVLTNKRLLFCGAKGLFKRELVIKKEIALKDISNVSGEIGKTNILGVTENSWLIVESKAGEKWEAGFSTDAMVMYDFHLANTQLQNKVTNWVTSIKLELLKLTK